MGCPGSDGAGIIASSASNYELTDLDMMKVTRAATWATVCALFGVLLSRHIFDRQNGELSLMQSHSKLLGRWEATRDWAMAHAGGEPLGDVWDGGALKRDFRRLLIEAEQRNSEKNQSPQWLTSVFESLFHKSKSYAHDLRAQSSRPVIPETNLGNIHNSEFQHTHVRSYGVNQGRELQVSDLKHSHNSKLPDMELLKPHGVASNHIENAGLKLLDRSVSFPMRQAEPKADQPDIAGMLFSWAAERGCGAGSCDEISGCDERAFHACIAARRPGPQETRLYEALRAQIGDSGEVLSDILRSVEADSCGTRACSVRRGCSSISYFRCLAHSSDAPPSHAESPSSGHTHEAPDFPRSGTDFSHGFDDARTKASAPPPDAAAAAPSIEASIFAPKSRPDSTKSESAHHYASKRRSQRELTVSGKGVFAPHSLEPSVDAEAERARFERQIRASTDFVFGRAAGAREDRSGRFPSLAGGKGGTAVAVGAIDATPATRAEVAAILRLAGTVGAGGRGRAGAARSRVVVPWERAVRRAVPPPWRENTSRDRAANRELRRAERRGGTAGAAKPGVAAEAALLGGSGRARFVELAEASGAGHGGEWRRMDGPGGRRYWLNSATGTTQWLPPSLSELRAAERRILKVCRGAARRAARSARDGESLSRSARAYGGRWCAPHRCVRG